MQSKVRRVLYLGTQLPTHQEGVEFIHCPMIEVKCKDLESLRSSFLNFTKSTHLIFTSRHAVLFTMEAVYYFFGDYTVLKDKIAIVIGPSTKQSLSCYDIKHLLPEVSTQEGVISLLDKMDLSEAYLFYPRSSRARSNLAVYLQQQKHAHHICDLYDTHASVLPQLPDLENMDEILFTSPSTVESFFSQIRCVPKYIKLKAIGPVTAEAIESQLSIQSSQVK